MAETITPSVRGRLRLEVAAAMTTGAIGSAGLAGLGFGIAGAAVGAGRQWTGAGLSGADPSAFSLPAPDPLMVVAAIVATAGVADVVVLVRGRPRPVTLGRQVPREWGRLLDPRLVAGLYGARLGVGPLTILSTWCWWATMVAAATVGVWTTVVVSVWFAAVRVAANELVTVRAGRSSRDGRSPDTAAHTRRFQRLVEIRTRGRAVISSLTLGLVVAAVVAGCGSASEPSLRETAPTGSTITNGSQSTGSQSTGSQSTGSQSTGGGADTPPTSLAYLEDVVRTSTSTDLDRSRSTGRSGSGTDHDGPDPATADRGWPPPAPGEPAVSAGPEALSAALPATLLGRPVVDDPDGNRYLTLTQAADIQPDPVEETALLETRGYQGGWIRAFRSEGDDIAVTSVYQFADATEAEFYLEDGLITIGGHGGRFFEVPSLPAVRGFKQDFELDGERLTTLGGAFFQDARWYLLYIVGTPETATAEVLVQALDELYRTATAA